MRTLIATKFFTLDGVIDSRGREGGSPRNGCASEAVAFDPAACDGVRHVSGRIIAFTKPALTEHEAHTSRLVKPVYCGQR